MPEEIRSKLQEIRSRLKFLLWLGGLSALISVVCGSVLAGAFLDRAIVGESLSGRVLLTLSIAVAVIWVFRKELLRPLSCPLSDVWIAQKIEAHHPDLRGSLASSVEFSSDQYSERNGSEILQKKSVSATVARVLSLNTDQLTSWRPLKLRLIPAVVLILICLLFSIFRSEDSLAALERLAFPFRTVDWPRNVVLQLEDERGTPLPEEDLQNAIFPRGSSREYRVRNLKGELPEDLQLELKYSDERTDRTPIPRETELNGEGLLGRIRLEMREAFSFRVTGGDDQTEWYVIDVVPPPVLKQLVLTVEPPEYTHQPPFDAPQGASFVQAVTGSVILISGEADIPLSKANLTEQNSEEIPFRLSAGNLKFEGEYPINQLGPTYLELRLTDEQGITNRSAVRLEVVGLADLPPTVKFSSPSTDQMLTPDAVISVELEANDEYGLVDLELQYLKKSSSGDWEPLLKKSLLTSEIPEQQTRVAFEFTAQDFELAAGDTFLLRAIAKDFLSSEEEHFGQDERQITLLTASRKQEELAGRLHELLDRIERERINQKLVRESFDNLFNERPPDATSEISGLTVDQRMIEQRLTSEPHGLLEEIRKIEQEADRNRLDHPTFKRRLQTLSSDLEALDRNVFPSLNQILVLIDPRLLKTAPSEQDFPNLIDPIDPLELNRLLNQTPPAHRGEHVHQLIESRQKQIEEVLGDLTGAIDEWQEGQTLKNSLSQILENQQQIDRDARQLNHETLGKEISELSPAQRDDLRELTIAQQSNHQRLDRFVQQLDRELTKSNSPEHLNDLTEAISQSNSKALMGELEREFRDNHLGQSLDQNQKLLAEMNNWDDLLHNRPVTDAEMKMQLLEKQLNALNDLQQRQQQFDRDAKETAFRNEIPESRREGLTETQQQIEREAGRIERNFQRLQLSEPKRQMSDARREMQQATSQLSEGKVPEEAMQEAETHLEQAVQSVVQAQENLQVEHERELAKDLLPRLRELHRNQGELLAESTELRIRQSRAQRWDRSLLRELKLAQKTQSSLRKNLEDLATPLKSLEAVELALNHVGLLMDRTISAFEDRDLQAATEQHLPATLEHLDIMMRVLERAVARQLAANSSNQAETQRSKEEASPDEDDNLLLQLIVLRAVQEQIHLRMSDLKKAEQDTASRAEQQANWDNLQSDQERVEGILSEAYERLKLAQTVSDSENVEELEHIVKTSRELLDRIETHVKDIEQQTLTDSTRVRQTEILRLWDTLLDETGQQPPSQPSSQPNSQDQNASSEQNPQSQPSPNQQQSNANSRTEDPEGEKQTEAGAQSEGERQENDPDQAADRSTEQTEAREAAIRSATLLRQEERRRLMRDVWGQLPPRLRQKLMNASDEEYLPEYQDNIREYFRKLSEQKRNVPPR